MERLSLKSPEFEIPPDDFDFIIRTAIRVDSYLEQLHGEPLPPAIICTLDTQSFYALVPPQMQIVKNLEQRGVNVEVSYQPDDWKICQLPLQTVSEGAMFVAERKFGGGTAWPECCRINPAIGNVASIIENPRQWAIPTPTTLWPEGQKDPFVRSVLISPPRYPSGLRTTGGYDTQAEYRLLYGHERGGHVREMETLPWQSGSHLTLWEPAKDQWVTRTRNILNRIPHQEKVFSLETFMGEWISEPGLPRAYIGELYAYLTEIYIYIQWALAGRSIIDFDNWYHLNKERTFQRSLIDEEKGRFAPERHYYGFMLANELAKVFGIQTAPYRKYLHFLEESMRGQISSSRLSS